MNAIADNPAANAPVGGAPGEVAQGEAQQPRTSMWDIAKSLVGRMLMFYLVMQGMNYFKGKPATQTQPQSAGDGSPAAQQIGNMFLMGSRLDMYAYFSESEIFDKFDEPQNLLWKLENIEYGNWVDGANGDGTFTHSAQIEVSPAIANNGTIFLHVYFTETGRSPNPKDKETYSKRRTFSSFKRLNKYSKKIYKTTKNLLTGDTEKDEEYQQKAKDNIIEIISYWHPNMTINLIDDHTPWQKSSVPPPLNEYIEFDKASGKYYPVIYLNDYWNLNSDYYPINSTLSQLPLYMTYAPMQLWKWQLYLSQNMRNQLLGSWQDEPSEDDQDTLKRTLLDTNPYLLGITGLVTLLHSVFEFLAFKNDIQFWRKRDSLKGLSVNSVLFGCFTQLIVLLYVLDNETNTIVRFSIGIGLLIDLWKIPKVVNVTIDYQNKWFGVIPRIRYVHKVSYVESDTVKYDRLAFKYLSWVLFPLVFGYAIYSLLYLEHKSWYSWVLGMIYGFLLTFGFIMMTPQLFINYKLKSVAHLPWRMMTYKALNTFIDDIFAFVIKMPTMYRIGCFRDDIIFFIYLYQRYIYPVDKKRTNEFGTSEEEHAGEQPAVTNADTVQSEEASTEASEATEASGHLKSE